MSHAPSRFGRSCLLAPSLLFVATSFVLVLAGCSHSPKARRVPTSNTDARAHADGATEPTEPDAATPVDSPSALTSIEFGATLYGTDQATRDDAPAGGTLFSVWTHVPDPTPTGGYSRGNMDVYVLYGDNWHMRCLTGNILVNSPSDVVFNANTMIFAGNSETWVDDYTLYYGPAPSIDAAFGWVWAAWLVVVEANGFTILQWLKYGLDGDVFLSGESHPTFDEMRQTLVSQRSWTQDAADAWIPTDAKFFHVGRDHGYLVQARMMATSSTPSLSTLDAWSRSSTGDGAAWADYRLGWVDGAPDLTDRSGHGRDLRIREGGTLHEGVPAPAF